MAFNPAPNTWIASWSEDGTNISVPIASFPQLTAVEADGATGDIRKVVYAILHKLHAEWDGKAEADRPKQMGVKRLFLPGESESTVVFQFSFDLAATQGDVAAE